MTRVLRNPADPLSADNAEQLVLYDGPASPCCRRCRITLLEKGLRWDTVYVNVAQLEQRSREYLRLNPNGLVPTLRHGTRVLFESGVINGYLEAQFPQVPLMPADAQGIARVRQWQAAELAMAKVFRPVMYARVMGPIKRLTRTRAEAEIIARHQCEEPWDVEWELKVWALDVLTDEQLTAHQAWLMDWLTPLERTLAAGRYVLGEQLTQADVSLFPRIEMYPNAGLEIDPARFPHLTRWMAELGQRPSFAESATEGLAQNLELSRSPELEAARAFFRGSQRDLHHLEDPALRALSERLREAQGVERLLSGAVKPAALPPHADLLRTPRERSVSATRRTDAAGLTLYGAMHTPEQQRVALLLDLLGLPYRREPQAPDALVDITAPNDGDLPLLQAGDLCLTDPPAIADYLLSLAPASAVDCPATSYRRAVHAMWLALESGTHKEFTRLAGLSTTDATGMEIVDRRIRWKLGILEHQLGATPYLCGDRMTFADLTWYTRIAALAPQLGAPDTLDLPAVARWHDRLAAELA